LAVAPAETGPNGRAFVPYVAPFALWMVLLAAQAHVPGGPLWIYPARVLVVAAALAYWWRHYEELGLRFSLLGMAVGVVAIVGWIAIDPHVPGLSSLLGGTPPRAFDPGSIESPGARLAFLGFRLAGAVLVVPLMEELFWRGFLARWLVGPAFKTVPVGRFTPFSFWATALLFGVEHEQWLAGIVCGVLYNALLWRTRDLSSCVLAHAVSNALLAAWVLSQKAWHLW
jgi:hypothetical protein